MIQGRRKGRADNRTHVLFLAAALHIGGAERVIANLCRFLDSKQFRVTVCWAKGTSCGQIGADLIRDGYEVIGLVERQPQRSSYQRFLTVCELARELNVDILHSHGTAPLADAAPCRLLKRHVRLVHTFHFGNYPNLPMRHLILERVFSRVPDRLIAVGVEQNKSIQSALVISPNRIDTIYNGVRPPCNLNDSTLARTLRHTAKDRPIIGSISTLIEQKGVSFLLQAAALLKAEGKKFMLVIAGDGPLRGQLEAQCGNLGLLEVVKFLGWIPDAADRLMPALDIFVQPSLWEAMSMVVLEAMAAGLPVVATDVGDNRHVIVHGQTGFVVNPKDGAAIARYVGSLLDDKLKRCSLGDAALQRYSEYFAVDRMVSQYETLYKQLTDDLTKPNAN